MLEFSNQLLLAANKSGKFFFADSDLKYDQPQTRIVFDRDKVAAMGLNLQQVGGDLTTLLSSGYVNYFSIQGRSYQVIPQLKRVERLTPTDLVNRYVTGPNGAQIQLSTIAHLEREVQPETLNHFQQLNSFTISGANGFGARSTTRSKSWKTKRRRFCRVATQSIMQTSHGSCERKETLLFRR